MEKVSELVEGSWYEVSGGAEIDVGSHQGRSGGCCRGYTRLGDKKVT